MLPFYPGVNSKLPISVEQRILLSEKRSCWVFCPLCVQVVRAEAVAHGVTEAVAPGAVPAQRVQALSGPHPAAFGQSA